MDLNLYNHFIFASVAATAVFICTNRWYRAGLWGMFILFILDLMVNIFIYFDAVRIIIALVAAPSILRDIRNKNVTHMSRKIRLLIGVLFVILGALTLTVLPHPYFLIAGIAITLFAYFDKK